MRDQLTQDNILSVIGACLKAADYHAARGERLDFEFWSLMADEIADLYHEYGTAISAIHEQNQPQR